MIITSKVNMDLIRQSWTEPISAVQDDRYSRNMEITLTADGAAWNIPEDAVVLIRYAKSDCKGGIYDTLPDGTKAWSFFGNVLTIALAPQMMTTPGPVRISVSLLQNEKQISTFSLLLNVHSYANGNLAASEEYVHIAGFLPAPIRGEVGQYLRISSVDENGRITGVESVELEDHAMIVNEVHGEIVVLPDVSGQKLQSLRVIGKTVQNGIPTPDVPVPLVSAGDDGRVVVGVYGKNILPPTAKATETKNGVTFKPVENGGISIVGTATSNTTYVLHSFTMNVKAGTTLTISGANEAVYVYIESNVSKSIKLNNSTAVVSSTSTNGSQFRTVRIMTDCALYVAVQVRATAGAIDMVVYPQIEISPVATEYEPYSIQTLTLSTPNGLSGIPVSSGGNYTDAEGRRWVCDEIDLERGVYVQRIGKIKSYSGEAVGDVYLSSTGELSTGAEVLYQLGASVVSNLTEEEVAAYAVLPVKKPVTVISTDTEAALSVKYVADTKAYIDNKFAVLSAAIVNGI